MLSKAKLLDKLTDHAFEIDKLNRTLEFKERLIKTYCEELAILREKLGQKGKKK